MKYTILVVDDERNAREGLMRALATEGRQVLAAASGEEAVRYLGDHPVDVLVTDIRMPRGDGLALLDQVKKLSPATTTIMVTGHATIEEAVAAMRDGAYDVLTKPVNLDQLELRIQQALEHKHLQRDNERLRRLVRQKYRLEDLIGKSEAMQQVFETIRRLGPTRATVLITGESGTGKDLVARAIHANSPRKDGPLVSVNCAALSENLLESESFGHERGAFTDAKRMNKGRFEVADGGTIFLDEVGEISLNVQAKLLRVLENKEFERVGSSRTIKVDVRIIAATNSDLREGIKTGTFREDLYWRLKVGTIHLPPLRERREDIPLLIETLLQDLAAEHGRDVPVIAPELLRTLVAHDWPGNVRQLRNVLERMVILSPGPELTLADLPGEMQQAPAGDTLSIPLNATLPEVERIFTLAVLDGYHGNRTKAARALDIGRRTLIRKLQEWGMGNVRGARGSDEDDEDAADKPDRRGTA